MGNPSRADRRAALLVSTLLIGALPSIAAADPVAIEGRVFVERTRLPIEHAEVRIHDDAGGDVSLSADRLGRFHAVGLAPGQVRLTVNVRGYAGLEATCPARDGETLRVNFAMFSSITMLRGFTVPCVVEPDTVDVYRID